MSLLLCPVTVFADWGSTPADLGTVPGLIVFRRTGCCPSSKSSPSPITTRVQRKDNVRWIKAQWIPHETHGPEQHNLGTTLAFSLFEGQPQPGSLHIICKGEVVFQRSRPTRHLKVFIGKQSIHFAVGKYCNRGVIL